jgi:hypothetical protein
MTRIHSSRRAAPKSWAKGGGDREITQVSVAEPWVHEASFPRANHRFSDIYQHSHCQGSFEAAVVTESVYSTPVIVFIIIVVGNLRSSLR